MLGDGYLHRPKPTNNTVLYIEQSYPSKEEYVNFLYKLMEAVVLNSPSVITRKPRSLAAYLPKGFALVQKSFFSSTSKIDNKNSESSITPRFITGITDAVLRRGVLLYL